MDEVWRFLHVDSVHRALSMPYCSSVRYTFEFREHKFREVAYPFFGLPHPARSKISQI